jgi:hypothetical protein
VVDLEGEFEGVDFWGEERLEEWSEREETGGDYSEGNLNHGPVEEGRGVDCWGLVGDEEQPNNLDEANEDGEDVDCADEKVLPRGEDRVEEDGEWGEESVGLLVDCLWRRGGTDIKTSNIIVITAIAV